MPPVTARTSSHSLRTLCAALAEEACSAHEVPPSLAREATRVTVSNLAPLAQGPLSGNECARVRAYFWSVVRRRALRTANASRFTARAVRESIAEDLRHAGFGDERIARELERCGVA